MLKERETIESKIGQNYIFMLYMLLFQPIIMLTMCLNNSAFGSSFFPQHNNGKIIWDARWRTFSSIRSAIPPRTSPFHVFEMFFKLNWNFHLKACLHYAILPICVSPPLETRKRSKRGKKQNNYDQLHAAWNALDEGGQLLFTRK